MKHITIELSAEQMDALNTQAKAQGESAQKHLQHMVSTLLDVEIKPSFDDAATHVLSKNVELYQRLS